MLPMLPKYESQLALQKVRVSNPDRDKWSALLIASKYGHAEVVEKLLENKAPVNMQDYDGWSALMRASEAGHANIVEILVENKAQGNMQGERWMVSHNNG